MVIRFLQNSITPQPNLRSPSTSCIRRCSPSSVSARLTPRGRPIPLQRVGSLRRTIPLGALAVFSFDSQAVDLIRRAEDKMVPRVRGRSRSQTCGNMAALYRLLRVFLATPKQELESWTDLAGLGCFSHGIRRTARRFARAGQLEKARPHLLRQDLARLFKDISRTRGSGRLQGLLLDRYPNH